MALLAVLPDVCVDVFRPTACRSVTRGCFLDPRDQGRPARLPASFPPHPEQGSLRNVASTPVNENERASAPREPSHHFRTTHCIDITIFVPHAPGSALRPDPAPPTAPAAPHTASRVRRSTRANSSVAFPLPASGQELPGPIHQPERLGSTPASPPIAAAQAQVIRQ